MQAKDPKDCLERIDNFIRHKFAGKANFDISTVITATIENCKSELVGAACFVQHYYIERRVWHFQKRCQKLFDDRQCELFPGLEYLPARIHYRDENGHSRSLPTLDAAKDEWHSFVAHYKHRHQEHVNRSNDRLDRLTDQFNARWDLYGEKLKIRELLDRAVENQNQADKDQPAQGTT